MRCERSEVCAHAGDSLLVLVLSLLGGAPQSLLNRGADRGAAKGALGSSEELLVDLDRRALDHMNILLERSCTQSCNLGVIMDSE